MHTEHSLQLPMLFQLMTVKPMKSLFQVCAEQDNSHLQLTVCIIITAEGTSVTQNMTWRVEVPTHIGTIGGRKLIIRIK